MPHPTHARLTGDPNAQARYRMLVTTLGEPEGSEAAVLVTLARLLSHDETTSLVQLARRALRERGIVLRELAEHLGRVGTPLPSDLAKRVRVSIERNGS